MRKFRLVDACEKENINRGNFPLGKMSEDSPVTSAEAAQRPEGVRRSRNHHGGSARGGGGGGGEPGPSEDQTGDERRSVDKEQEEKARVHRAVGVLRELGASQADKLTALRGVIRECAFMLQTSPPGGGVQRRPATAGCKTRPKSDHLSDIFHSVEEDMEHILDKLQQIITELDLAVLQLSSDRASANVAEALPESKGTDSSVSSQASKPEGTGNNPVEIPPGCEPEAEDDQPHMRPSSGSEKEPETGLRISDCNKVEENREQLQVERPVFHFPEKPVHSQANKQEETQKETEEKREEDNFIKKEEKKEEWVTVGLTGQMEGSCPDEADGCFIRAPPAVAKVLRCETADQLSCLMVSGSEELVSRVVRVEGQSGASFHFPLTVAVPFCVRHRGSYRDVAVKIISEGRRVSYLTPVTSEGVHGGRQGTFAEAKVYSLGLFAVVYCLKRENYIIPKRGLSLKLPMDSRICLNYLPGSFTAPVMAQTMVQPVDAVLLAAVRSRNDAYRPVVSASPLLYLTHPNTQPLRRTLTITLPCPPNPEKNREARGQDHPNCQHQTIRAALPSPARLRTMNDPLKSQEISGESLILLGSRDAQWSVLDNVAVRNVQNGLVSFELEETWDRLLVVRLLSPLQPCDLASLAEELVESSRCHSVTVVLQRPKEEPRAASLTALPSRELSWELSRLRAQGLHGLVETSSEISMCEADQLVLRFSGNIGSTGSAENDKNEGERLTFHSQRRNRLLVHLTELDPFGNYSSPHYKGTALLYRVSRGRLEWGGDKAVLKDSKLLGDPVCKMPLTLPKKARVINRPTAARVKLCEETEFLSDALLLWLAGELSREETALLVSSLRLRRSAVQLVKLRAGDSPPAQAFQVLAAWRRAQPSVPHQPKASQLAQSLARSGRPDLARELLLRQAQLSETRRPRKQSSQCGCPATHGQKN
ncbi:death domain-containing protein 1 [Menidia menidia]